MRRSIIKVGLITVLLWVLSACSVHDMPTQGLSFDAHQRWVMLPIPNYSVEPLAGERAEAMLGTLLQTRAFDKLTYYTNIDVNGGMPELNERARLNQALRWARTQGFRYGLSGSISEWRYKSGLDAEPAVGMTLQVLDITTGQVIWSASGARSGWGRESLSGNAQKVIRSLVESVPLINN